MPQHLDPTINAAIRAAVEHRRIGRGHPAAQHNQTAAAQFEVVALAAAAAMGLTDDQIADLTPGDIEQLGANVVAASWHYGNRAPYDADYVDALGRSQHRVDIDDEQAAIDDGVAEYRCPECHHDVDESKFQHQPCSSCAEGTPPKQQRRTYTVTVTVDQRHEAPYIYRTYAESEQAAALNACMALAIDLGAFDIDVVKVEEGSPDVAVIKDLRLEPVSGDSEARQAALAAVTRWQLPEATVSQPPSTVAAEAVRNERVITEDEDNSGEELVAAVEIHETGVYKVALTRSYIEELCKETPGRDWRTLLDDDEKLLELCTNDNYAWCADRSIESIKDRHRTDK